MAASDSYEDNYEYGIDLFKYIASLFVVGMHTEFLHDVSDFGYLIADNLFRFAVPFFFLSSGYFFEKHSFPDKGTMRGYIIRYIKRLLLPFLIWGGVYAAVDVIGDILFDSTSFQAAVLSKIHEWILVSPGGGLWYIYALIWMMLILYLFYDTQTTWSLIALLVVFSGLYVLRPVWSLSIYQDTVLGTIKRIYDAVIPSELTFFFHMLFFMTGTLYARIKPYFTEKVQIRFAVCWLLSGYCCYLFTENYICSLPGAILYQLFRLNISVAYFGLAICISRIIKTKTNLKCLCKKLGSMSAVIYFSHFFVIYCIRFLCVVLDVDYQSKLTVSCVLCWLILSIYSSWTINNKHRKVLRILYPI